MFSCATLVIFRLATMKDNREFWIIFIAFAKIVTLVFSLPDGKTYVLTLPNGKTQVCFMCSPGHYLEKHCTKDNIKATCNKCPNDMFTPNYNLARKCQECSKTCQTPEEMVTKNCTETSDIVCECREGYYRESGLYGRCLPLHKCPPGQGVKKQGKCFI